MRSLLAFLPALFLSAQAPAGVDFGQLFVVDTLGDAPDADAADGRCDSDLAAAGDQCTLNAAIAAANAAVAALPDRIAFDLPGTGPWTIDLDTCPEVIVDPVFIDGSSQPGFVDQPVVEVRALAECAGGALLELDVNGSTVRGLALTDLLARNVGVRLGGAFNTLAGNWIGLGVDGVERGFITGVELGSEAVENDIGGEGALDGNVVSGNEGPGIRVLGPRNVLLGNLVGTDPGGSEARPNAGDGILLSGPSADDNAIGGATGGGNLVSGNTGNGISISGGASGNQVLGNRIGTDLDGAAALGNGGRGVTLGASAGGNEVRGNLISGNALQGVLLAAASNTLADNLVGTDAAGADAGLGNGSHGISVCCNVFDSAITGNRVAWNGAAGVRIQGAGTGNELAQNRIHDNGGPGIDLGDEGVTANDPGDLDGAGRDNDLQNFPVLTGFTRGGRVTGTLQSLPGTDFRVELYFNRSCDETGFGEGEALARTLELSTDAGGLASFEAIVGFDPGQPLLTAMATRLPAGNSSEFSECAEAEDIPAAAADLALEKTSSAVAPAPGDEIAFTLTVSNRGPDPAAGVELLDPLPPELAFRGVSPPAGWACAAPGGQLRCTTALLEAGSSAAIVLQAEVLSGPTVLNRASVRAEVLEDPPADNEAGVRLEVFDPDRVFRSGFEAGDTPPLPR